MTFRSRDWVGDGEHHAVHNPNVVARLDAPIRASGARRADRATPRLASLLLAVAVVAALAVALGLLFR